MQPRAHTLVVVAVVAVVAAAPAAGIAPASAAAGGPGPTDALDRPAVDDWNDTASDESDGWPFTDLDDEESEEDEADGGDGDESERGDENGDERDRDGDDSERDSDGDDDSGDSDWEWDWDEGEDDVGDDEREAGGGSDGDDAPGAPQQSEGASDDERPESVQPNDREKTDDNGEDRSVRVDAQEDNESQEGGEGQEGGDGERNETRTDTAEPGPDVGSANVTVLRTPKVVGQPLVVEATTTNEGTEAGRKVVQFEVEHEVLDNRSFVLQPGETRTVTFRHVFETTGNKTFEVDTGKNRFVTVEERRPNLSVSTVAVSPRSVEAGGDVTITATVSNAGYANGTMPVALELFGEVVGVKNVTLATGESTDVSFTRSVHAPGSYEAVVENQTAEFRVVDGQDDQPTATGNESVLKSAAETPGFGASVAVLAGVLAALVLALRGRE